MQAIYDLGGDDGAVNVSRICAAWQQITERHSALRTVFSDSVSNHDLYDQIILRRHSPNMLFIESTNAGNARSITLPRKRAASMHKTRAGRHLGVVPTETRGSEQRRSRRGRTTEVSRTCNQFQRISKVVQRQSGAASRRMFPNTGLQEWCEMFCCV